MLGAYVSPSQPANTGLTGSSPMIADADRQAANLVSLMAASQIGNAEMEARALLPNSDEYHARRAERAPSEEARNWVPRLPKMRSEKAGAEVQAVGGQEQRDEQAGAAEHGKQLKSFGL